ncbi:Protein SON [Bagarius yarrelli]|uniref:Protein SON n=1 Tax=Bagarius yarrelli TaxID=175774 RepID=A0A556TKF0_BAGYA|nr:Protein SON [Bagarius yarrelli]
MLPAGDMLKFVLLLFAVAGFNARPLQYNDLRIQNGGWVIGAPQLVQNGQEYMGNFVPAENSRQHPRSEPQWEVVLAPEQTVKTRADMDQKVASIEEHRQGTEPSRRLVVDLDTGLLKEYVVYNPVSNPEFRQGTQNSRVTLVDIRTGHQLPQLSEMQRRVEPMSQFRQGTEYSEKNLIELRKDQKSYNPTSNPEFRQGTQNSRVTLVDIRTGHPLPQLSEMQRRAEPLSQFRQGTEYSETNLIELRKNQKSYNPANNAEFRQGTENSRVTLVDIRTGQELPQLSEMQRRAEPLSQFRQGTEYSETNLMELRKNQKSYNPASNPEFRQGTQDSRVTLVDIRTGQELPQLSEMQRKAEPFKFKQGTEYNLVNLINLRKMSKTQQDIETNEVYPEYKRGIAYSQAQRRHIMSQHRFQALESNEGALWDTSKKISRAQQKKMATDIEQIFRDFVMNKIKEIEDESQDKSHEDKVESTNGASHSKQESGVNKEAAPSESLSTATDKVSIMASQGNSGKEELNTKHKKSKKHKKHKSKKKKKKHKEVMESSSGAKKKKRKKKKKHNRTEKGKKVNSHSGSSSESESKSEIKPLCETVKTSSGKTPQDLPDIIPKLDSASDKHKDIKNVKRSSSRSRTSRQDKTSKRQRSRSSSAAKQKTRRRSRSRTPRRSSRSKSPLSPRRRATQKRWRSRSRSGSQRRNRRSRSRSGRRGRHSRSGSRSRRNRSRSNVGKSRRSRSKSRSRSHRSGRSRSGGPDKRSSSSSRSKSRSFSDQHPESEKQKNSVSAEIKPDASLNKSLNKQNGDTEKSQTMPINPTDSVQDAVTDDGKVTRTAGSWKPIPFLNAGVTVSDSADPNKCITPAMPVDMKEISVSTSVDSGDLHSTEKKEEISSAELKDPQVIKQNQRRSKSPLKKRSSSGSPLRRRKSRSSSRNSRKSPLHHKRSRSRKRTKRSKSKSPKRKRSKSQSPGRQRRSRVLDRKRSKSRHRSRSQSRRSRSGSRRKRGVFRSRMFSQRDRWKREPSHSPVVILRKKRSTSRTRRSTSKTPPRLTELDKEQLLEIAKANAAAMCAKAGMPIPESLRPKILQLPLPNPNPSPLPLPLPLPVNISMGMQGMANMTMNAAVASMTAATMTAALSGMNALAAMPQLAPLPTITNKPPPSAAPNVNLVTIEEAKKKLAKQANTYSIKELTEKCKKIAESKEEMAVAKPHVSDDEEDDRPFGGNALKENKGITFSLSNPSVKPAVRSEAAFAKEFPVSSGSQHRKKEEDGVYGEWMPVDKKTEKAGAPSAPAGAEDQGKASDSVFPQAPSQPVDITLAISERAVAQKRLAENPFDINAMCMLNRAQEQVDAWAQSNTIPGLFTGSTGAQVLSSEELSNSGPQAWIKKDQFLRAAPVSGGMGELLMKKMGWRTGEGLGKHREGTVEPIVIDFKTDRKGLVAEGEKTQKSGNLVMMKDLLGKHPVSALMELCNKKKWPQPEFVMVLHSGPDHRKNFLFKVMVNGCDYQPQTASPNKKHAKAMAATVALQAMGEIAGDGVHSGPQFTAATST